MQPHISLTSVLVAIVLFAVAVAMHEAARADGDQGRYDFGSAGNQTDSAAAQGGTRLRAKFLSIPDSIHSGSPKALTVSARACRKNAQIDPRPGSRCYNFLLPARGSEGSASCAKSPRAICSYSLA
jgi:hypothetical protein